MSCTAMAFTDLHHFYLDSATNIVTLACSLGSALIAICVSIPTIEWQNHFQI